MTTPEPSLAASRTDSAAVLAALDRLAEVLERENAALRSRDARTLAALAKDKRAAVAACEHLVEASAAGADVTSTISPGAALVRAKTRLVALMEENQQRLRVAMLANQRLVETIAAAAQAKVPGASAYASDGRRGTPGSYTSNPPALSFNRAL